jgi:hypothetical protein
MPGMVGDPYMDEPLQLDNAAVRRVLDDIGGQGGSIALVPTRLVALGLPSAFVESVTRLDAIAKIQSTADMMAGLAPEQSRGTAIVWSLELLEAIAGHYGLSTERALFGHNRNAYALSARILAHLNA